MTTRQVLLGIVVLGSAPLPACRRSTPAGVSAEGTAPPVSSTPEPPPLETNWQRDPGHLLTQGERAPDFEGIAHTGMRVKPSRFSGKPVVVYFCAKTASSEGTAEARGYRDNWMRFNEKVGTVLGVSTDDRATLYDFATAERLPFLLVADERSSIARAFGVVPDRLQSACVAFVVGPDGKVASAFTDPTPEGQVAGVVKSLESS